MSQSGSGKRQGSYLVGIAGGSASGKSTFTAELLKQLTSGEAPLRAELFGQDRYMYRGSDGGPTLILPSTGELLPDNNHPNSADNARLLTDLLAKRNAADAPDVILLEGLMTLHVDEIREQLDLRLFIELEADARALRRLLRDMSGSRGNTDPKWIATYFLECARIGHAKYVEPSRVYADIILRGDADFTRIAPLIADLIRAQS